MAATSIIAPTYTKSPPIRNLQPQNHRFRKNRHCLTAADGNQLFIPRGFAHAYCTLEPDTIFAYKVDGYYDKAFERGIRFDDPDIAIEWPLPHAEMKVSEKDAALPYLRDAAMPFQFGS